MLGVMTHEALTELASKHIRDILEHSIEYRAPARALVVYDTENGLTNMLTAAYRTCLPEAQFLDFNSVSKEEVLAAFDMLSPNDLVVLIQTSNFRLDDFRIRLHLFQKKLKVIEHMHLYRNREEVWDVYINALAYDKEWYRAMGPAVSAKLARAQSLTITANDATLAVSGALEQPKLNIGDYRDMENVGGTFPIGEVFTEAKNFADMHGSFYIYAYAGPDFVIEMHEPFRVDVENGLIVSWAENAPQSFIDIVNLIKEFERPLIREIGFGLNRAITCERFLEDITAFERIYGMHFSLGEKHSVYKKDGIQTNKTKFHVDLFPLVDRVVTDKEVVFEGGKYLE